MKFMIYLIVFISILSSIDYVHTKCILDLTHDAKNFIKVDNDPIELLKDDLSVLSDYCPNIFKLTQESKFY